MMARIVACTPWVSAGEGIGSLEAFLFNVDRIDKRPRQAHVAIIARDFTDCATSCRRLGFLLRSSDIANEFGVSCTS
jgi:hypothetical protein